MKTLIIYDSTGYIVSQTNGDVREPVGIPFLWVDVPDGKKLISVDTTVTPNAAVYEDIPKTEIETLKEQIDGLFNTVVMMSMM